MCAAVAPCFGVFEPLGDLPGDPYHTEALAISGDGFYVTGQAADIAFLWTPGQGLSQIRPNGVGGNQTTARALDLTGDWIVGDSRTNTTSLALAWPREGDPVALGDFPGGTLWSTATAVSADGRFIVGQGTNANGSFAFRYQKDTGLQLLGAPGSDWLSSMPQDMSPSGQIVVGECSTLAGERAFLWRSDSGFRTMPMTADSVGASAHGVDASGTIVVGERDTGSRLVAVFWEGIHIHDIPPLDDEQSDSVAVDVSDDGTLIVGYAVTPAGQEPFIYPRGGSTMRVADFLALHEIGPPEGWALTKVNAIVKHGGFIVMAGAASNVFAHEEGWVAWIKMPPLADIDGDGRVNITDFLILAAAYDSRPGEPRFDTRADIDRNYMVDVNDFIMLAATYED